MIYTCAFTCSKNEMSSDAEASKVPFEIFFHINCHLSEFTELKYTSLIKKKIYHSRRQNEFQMALRGFCI